jgi:hypothetical protein
MQMGGCVDFYVLLFGVVYLFGLMRYRNGSDKVTASNIVQISEKVQLRPPWQWLDKLLGIKHEPCPRNSKINETEKGKTGEEQSQEHAHHFL